MRTSTKYIVFFFLVTFLSQPIFAASESVGKVVFVKGKASVLRLQEKGSKDLAFNDDIYSMDTLETKDGVLKILFEDQTVMSLAEDSKVLITEQIYKPKQGIRKSIFDILKGKVRTIVEKVPLAQENDVRLQTPTAVAGIRGTDVGINVSGSTTQFLCFDGSIETYFKGLPKQTVIVTTGHYTTIQSGAPTPPSNIPSGMQKPFHMGSPVLRDVLGQSGGQDLHHEENVPPPPPRADNNRNQNNSGRDGENKKQGDQQAGLQNGGPENNPNNPPPGQQPPPPILPGGNTDTPSTLAPPGSPGSPGTPPAGGGAGAPAPVTAPVDVPVTFPTPG